MRNINTDKNQNHTVGAFLDYFHLSITVDNFCNEGVIVQDADGRKVAPCYGILREGMVHVGAPYAEIMVIGVDDGVFLGWCRADQMIDAGDRFLVPVKALNKMPVGEFRFVQECPHMSVYGGFAAPGSSMWECLGCSKEIVVQ